ncbi:MAG: protein translocase subunit SecF [Propionibacteriales bacterium]|nr:protein translocase subunit SecF [Propionibacteriales bacterium]
MSKLGEIGARLYRGDVSVDFVGRRKTWYLMSLAIVLVALAGLLFRGLNFGIEFRGGVEFNAQIANPSASVEKVTNAVVDTQIEPALNPVVISSGSNAIRVQTKSLTIDETEVVAQAIEDAGATEVNPAEIGPTWGAAIANRALTGLIVFVVLVVLFIWAYFREWRMSVAAIVALVHDLIITIGVYALTGFEVTPATVTGILTILGYSLYDTVVVFDKVRENTRGVATSTRRTYADSANLAVNQTLVRSINTSLAALLPVGAILYVGAFQLGSGPLKDLALALFVGMAAGAYSSIFIATPLLAQLKMREPAMQAQAKRVASRRPAVAKPAMSTSSVTAAKVAKPPQPAVGAGSTAAGLTTPGQLDARPEPDGGSSDAGPEPDDGSSDIEADLDAESDLEPDETAATKPVRPRPVRTPTAARPMNSAASKRAQPQRQARSKRGKGR